MSQSEDDDSSPERQRANCQAYCDFRGWQAEFYEDTVWRGYADAAERVLQLYGQNLYGRRKIADIVNHEGFRFRNGDGQPMPFKPENIRGIVANWVEYGGAVVGSRARNRRAKNVTPDSVILNPERAIFGVDMCYQVGRVRLIRTRDAKRTPDFATHTDSAIYPLSKIVFCAHCDRRAVEQNDPSAKTYLTGLHARRNKPRYRHKERNSKCEALNQSVLAETLESDFARLVSHLAVKPDTLPVMARWFEAINRESQTPDQRTEILAEIAEWKQRIKNVDAMFRRARISEGEWDQDVRECEHQIALLEAKLSEQTEIRQMLEITAASIADMETNWYSAKPADRQAFAHSLLSEISYDLDTRRIVGFKLKPWAESFLQLKVGLEEILDQQSAENVAEPLYTAVHPEGFGSTSRDSIFIAVMIILRVLYKNRPRPIMPRTSMIPAKTDRNLEIVDRYLAGERAADLAQRYGISVRRVNRLIRRFLDRT